MWDQVKNANRAVQEVFGMIKRKPGFAPAFKVSGHGFPSVNHAGREASKVICHKYGHDSGATFNAAMVHLFRSAANNAGLQIEARIMRRGQKPKIKPVTDPENFWANLMPRDAEVVLTIARRDGPLRQQGIQARLG